MKKLILLILVMAGVSLTWAFHELRSAKTINTTSPGKTYNLRFVGEQSHRASGLPIEKFTLYAFRNSKLILTEDPFFEADPYDASFADSFPKLEWLDSSTFGMGGDFPGHSYAEINVYNRSQEMIPYISVNYGPYELFLIFDLVPQGRTTLKAYSSFTRPDEAYAGFHGATQDGRTFHGISKVLDRDNRGGPLIFSIEVPDKQ